MTVKKVLRVIAAVLLVVTLIPSLACMGKIQQAAQKVKDQNDLAQIGMLYHSYCDLNSGKPPATLDEFVKFAQTNQPGAAPAISGLQSGKYVIYLGVDFKKQTQGTGNTVLAYDANVPTAGGPVVMADGMVRQMTAAEFAAATKPVGGTLSK
jgi:hypothetical protein